MNTHVIAETPSPAYSQAVSATLSLEDLRRRTPAVFADSASERTKPTYRFINTHEVLQALMDAGFQVADARQTRTRRGTDPIHARHMIRLRPMREILTLDSCIPEVCLINAHDGTNAYLMLIFACHHRRDSTCYPAYLQLTPRRGRMVTFSEKLTVRNGEAGARDHLILRHRSRRQGAPLLTRCARCGRPAATALMLLMP